jgi:hypothetical protein
MEWIRLLLEVGLNEKVCKGILIPCAPLLLHPLRNILVHACSFYLAHSMEPGFGCQKQLHLATAQGMLGNGSCTNRIATILKAMVLPKVVHLQRDVNRIPI